MIHRRPLTTAEIAALPAGLVAALPAGGVTLVSAHHPLSRLSQVLRGYALILVRGRRIFWPDLKDDMSADAILMSILAHELVHILQYEAGMTLWRYFWRDTVRERGRYHYKLTPGKAFTAYGYEQQAAMMEDWMRWRSDLNIRFGVAGTAHEQLEAIIPYLKAVA